MFAIVKISGSQYVVEPGMRLEVAKLPYEAGKKVEFAHVMLVSDTKDISVGKPYVKDAKVMAKIVDQKRGTKLIVFKYHSKTRYRVKRGFRPEYTKLLIEEIVV